MKTYSVTIEKDGPGRYFVVAKDWLGNRVEFTPRQLTGGHRGAALRKAKALREQLASGTPLK